MEKEIDEISCAVLLRQSPSREWEFIHYTTKKSVAWRSANMLRQDEADNGLPKAQAIVVLREDYDLGRLKPLKPPKGFDLSLPVQESVSAAPKPVPAPEPEPELADKPETDVRAGLRRLLEAEPEPEPAAPEPESEPEPAPEVQKPAPEPRTKKPKKPRLGGLDL